MNVHLYRTQGGKDLLLDYIMKLSKQEIIDGLSVLKEVLHMPFEKINVNQTINDILSTDSELKKMWNESRTEYKALGELVKLRKDKGISQVELAKMTGNKQQVISRIENRENSPTLKTLCSILDVLGYDIKFVPKEQTQ